MNSFAAGRFTHSLSRQVDVLKDNVESRLLKIRFFILWFLTRCLEELLP